VAGFLAIDFETADRSRTSACAVGVAYANGGRIVAADAYLIRPPHRQFRNTRIHGITWDDVRDAPTFGQLWPTLRGYIERADYLVAHNAMFDKGVLRRCCETYSFAIPQYPFVCTVEVARSQWGIYPTTLPDVCRHLDIPLQHHDAASDARACAEILLRAQREGWRR
jgi:DNA polymerase-3 subunit epsilon